MKIRFNQNNKNLLINKEQNFKTDAGWDENFQSYEDEVLRDIINPVENYETNRYIHKPYISGIGNPPPVSSGPADNSESSSASLFTTTVNTVEQTDIWFHFYFKDSSNNYTLDYKNVGITQTDKLMANLKYSFFRLEFYKTPNNEPPNRSNRRLVFAKNLAPAIGERVTFTNKFEKMYVPVFFGSSMRNKENMYLFWFHDDTVLEETELTGTTFYMSAKFYNSADGTKVQFANKQITNTQLNDSTELITGLLDCWMVRLLDCSILGLLYAWVIGFGCWVKGCRLKVEGCGAEPSTFNLQPSTT